MKVHADVVM